jgi:hypothetical protein
MRGDFMKSLLSIASAFVVASILVAGEPLKSGPQAGQELPGPFHPLNVTGTNAGEKACLYCQFGNSPVAMVFARQVTPEVISLVKKLDAATETHRAAELCGCVIFCNDDGALKARLEDVAKKESIKNVVLAIDNPAGPKEYQVAKPADVRVVLYTEHTVKANHAFRAGELDEKAIAKVLADLPKIVSEKK